MEKWQWYVVTVTAARGRIVTLTVHRAPSAVEAAEVVLWCDARAWPCKRVADGDWAVVEGYGNGRKYRAVARPAVPVASEA